MRESLGRAMSYIILYSWIALPYAAVVFLLSYMVETFTCPSLEIVGICPAGFVWWFGFGCTVMCNSQLAVSGFFHILSVLLAFLAIIVGIFFLIISSIAKIPLFKGGLKLDPLTNFILSRAFRKAKSMEEKGTIKTSWEKD